MTEPISQQRTPPFRFCREANVLDGFDAEGLDDGLKSHCV
jgi:hypothetical protein